MEQRNEQISRFNRLWTTENVYLWQKAVSGMCLSACQSVGLGTGFRGCKTATTSCLAVTSLIAFFFQFFPPPPCPHTPFSLAYRKLSLIGM